MTAPPTPPESARCAQPTASAYPEFAAKANACPATNARTLTAALIVPKLTAIAEWTASARAISAPLTVRI